MDARIASERPNEPKGLALWFSGAPSDARLAITQFWHPAAKGVCDGSRDSIVASAANGSIKWGRRDRTPKALAHFAVCTARHMIQTKGRVEVGYSGCALKTLYSAFKRGSNRCASLKAIFGVSGTNKSMTVALGERMEHSFIVIEGEEKSPIVRLHEDFDPARRPGEAFPIYIFWQASPPTRPDWSLPRVEDPELLSRMAETLERSLDPSVPRGSFMGPDAGFEGEDTEVKNGVDLGLASAEASDRRRGRDTQDQDFTLSDEEAVVIAKRNFLKMLFALILGGDSVACPSSWAANYLSDEAFAKRPYLASAEELVRSCDDARLVHDSYRKTISFVGSEWAKLRPFVKAEIRNHLGNSILSKDLPRLPPLSIEDQENLPIRWEKADDDYRRKKQEAMARCEALASCIVGKDLPLRFLGSAMDAVGQLLEEKVEIDKSHVLLAGAKLSPMNLSYIRNRASKEYSKLLDLLRDAHIRAEDWATWRRAIRAGDQAKDPSAPIVVDELARHLDPLVAKWKQIESLLGLEEWSPRE